MKNRFAIALCAVTTTVATASLLSCSAPSARTASAPHPPVILGSSALPSGEAPRSEYLVGRTIHPLNGAPVSLPSTWNLGYRGSRLTLVGSADGGWYVERFDTSNGDQRLYRVTREGVRVIDKGSWSGEPLEWYLSDDDQRLIKVQPAYDATTRLTVLTLTGTVLGTRPAEAGGALVAASGHDVWSDGGASGVRIQQWDLADHATTTLPVTGYLADPARDLLFTLPRGAVPAGLTSLAHPATAPRWTADFTAVAVSPDGMKVVGFRGAPTRDKDWILEIRNIADGSLIQTIWLRDPTYPGSGDLWWEDDQHVLFGAKLTTTHAVVLVRCSTDGACDRATGPVPDDLSFTHRRVQYVDQRSESVTDPSGSDLSGPLVAPAALPIGGPARSDYLVGHDIHTVAGGIIHLPSAWPTHARRYPLITLVGEVGSVHYVERWGPRYGFAELYRVTSSGMRRIDAVRGFTPVLGWFLTSDDKRIVRAWSDGYGNDGEEVMDLRGTEIAHYDNRADSNFNGASASDLWYTQTTEGSKTQRWSVGDDTATELGAGGYLAVPDRDLLFTAPDLGIGPGVTSLSRPGTLTWEARFRAVAVSPDGTKVLGYKGFMASPGSTVEIRNLSDGSLVRSFRFPTGGIWGDIWWESDDNVLLSYTTNDTWLIRCSTAGACRRVARDPSDSLGYTHRTVPTWHAEVSH